MASELDIVPALLTLAESGIGADIQALLVHGDPGRNIPPGALQKAIVAVRSWDAEAPTRLREVLKLAAAGISAHERQDAGAAMAMASSLRRIASQATTLKGEQQ